MTADRCPQASAPTLDAVSRYTFTIACPRCDGVMRHVTASDAKPVLSQRVMAIVHCDPCRETFEIVVELSSTRVRQMRAAYHDKAVEAHAAIAERELAR